MHKEENLRIKKQYSIVAHSPNIAELRCGVWNPISFTLTDEEESGHLTKILMRLDGSVSPLELARAEGIAPGEVAGLLDQLIELGVVESGSSNCFDHYLYHIIPTLKPVDNTEGSDLPVVLLGDPALTSEIHRYLSSSSKSSIITIADADSPALSVLFRNDTSWLTEGVAFEERMELFEHWRNKLLIFAEKTINPIRFRILNRVSLEHRIPWIHAALDGPFLLIGPIFIPHRSACYECFETRVMMNLRDNASYQKYKQALLEEHVKSGELPIEPLLGGILASHTAMEALNFILTRNSFTVGKVLAIYLPTMEFTFNEVLRIPGCAACSPLPERDAPELYFDMRAFIQHR